MIHAKMNDRQAGAPALSSALLWLPLLAALVAALPCRRADAEPMQLALQGRLTAVGGGPVADGGYALNIGIYAQLSGGNAVFDESLLAVSVVSGGFSESLGAAKTVLDSGVFSDGKPLWLGVIVGKDELPRVPLARTPYAAQAVVAKLAINLECSGCVGAGDLAPGLFDGYAKVAELAKVAASGNYADLLGKPALADVAMTGAYPDLVGLPPLAKVGTACGTGLVVVGLHKDGSLDCATAAYLPLKGGTVTGTLQLQGKLELGSSTIAGGRFEALDLAKTPCTADNGGQVAWALANQRLYFCDGKAWRRLSVCTNAACADAAVVACGQPVTDNCGEVCVGIGTFCGGNGKCVAGKCSGPLGSQGNPAKSCKEIASSAGGSTSGSYYLSQNGQTFAAHCDMATAGGGWTLALNLDTADGHVMWWGNPLWTNVTTKGTAQVSGGDYKGEPWATYAATKILVVVHANGVYKGYKVFQKPDNATLAALLAGGDNTLIGKSVLTSSTAGIWSGERLVRLSTKLYANHCVGPGAPCVGSALQANTQTQSDGDRIGSDEGTPSENVGGGLGNWHDMGDCCSGQTYAGKVCNGAAIRTASEAQAGWATCYGGNGLLGSDTFAPASASCDNSDCAKAAWAGKSGEDLDYAVFLGED